jgi:hypothetical protein
MPNITTISSFTEEPIRIPNAVNESAGVDDNSGLDRVISENERIILKQALGATQYAALQTELAKTPFDPTSGETASQDFTALVNGSGAWGGLLPMLENYIFCAWLRTTEIKQTMVSAGKGKTQGFTVADNSSKYTERWNFFVDYYGDLMTFISDSEYFEYELQEEVYEYVNSLGL